MRNLTAGQVELFVGLCILIFGVILGYGLREWQERRREAKEVLEGRLQPGQYERRKTTQKNLANRITNALKMAASLNPTYQSRLAVGPKIVVENTGFDQDGSSYILVGTNYQYHTLWILRVYVTSGLQIISRSDNSGPELNIPATETNIRMSLIELEKFVRTFGSTSK